MLIGAYLPRATAEKESLVPKGIHFTNYKCDRTELVNCFYFFKLCGMMRLCSLGKNRYLAAYERIAAED